MNNVMEKLKSLYNYINVTIDKDFAIELIPVIELVMINTNTIEKLVKSEMSFFEKLYVNYCDSHGLQTKLYRQILEKSDNSVKYKILNLLDALYDIMKENTPTWNKRWKIKKYHKIKYNEIKKDKFGTEIVVLKTKPEYVEKERENEKISKYNYKQYKKCKKWRNLNINFYKKVLKTINN